MNEGTNMEVQGTNNQTTGVAETSSLTQGGVDQSKFTKVIKRYQNRKLYDTHQSCYVTLDEIADMIVRGEEVTVIDNRTKKDITSTTLTQIIFEKQKRSKTLIPVNTLRDIIQLGGGTFSGFLSKTAESGSSILSKAKEDLERSFSATENIRGTFQVTQRAAEDLKRAIGDRVTSSTGKSTDALNAAQAQLKNLSTQLDNIEKLIDAAEARSGMA